MDNRMLPISRKGDGLKRALFLCADNYRASRFCEELFNSLVRDEGLNWQAISRALEPGAAQRVAAPVAPEVVAALRSRGAAPVNHRRLPLAVNPFDYETSHVIVAIVSDPRVLARAPIAERLPASVDVWSPDRGRPSSLQFEGLAGGVEGMLDAITGRDRAMREGVRLRTAPTKASAKLCTQTFIGHEQAYARFEELAQSRPRVSSR
jgi:protein-tyrosine-phosphatase